MRGDFAAKLKKLLRERGLTQRQLARNVGTAERNISRYAKGQAIPRDELIIKIENSLGVNKGTLLVLAEQETGYSGDNIHEMTRREEEILKAWKRGKRTPEEVSEITGYPLCIVGQYLPLGIEKEYL